MSFLALVSIISQYEFYSIIKANKNVETFSIHAIIFGIAWLILALFAPQLLLHVLFLVSIIFLLLNLRESIKETISRYAFTFAGFVYIPLMLSGLVMLRELHNYTEITNGEAWRIVLVLFICVWLNDTFAYVFGSIFGKTKLAPRISPNKSCEGSLAGLVGAFCTVFGAYYLNFLPDFFTIYHTIILSFILGVMPQLGDLVESMMKRDCEVKDTGKILLGHGGVMDRFDAIFLASPAVYLFIDISLKLIN